MEALSPMDQYAMRAREAHELADQIDNEYEDWKKKSIAESKRIFGARWMMMNYYQKKIEQTRDSAELLREYAILLRAKE